MSDVETAPDTVSDANQNGEVDLSNAAPINRGVGRKLADVLADENTKPVWDEFVSKVAEHKTAVETEERLKNERNAMIRTLKDDHNVSFTAMSEIVGTSTSFVEYAYERAAGKSAKQIRDEKRASAALKQKMREEDPDYEAKQGRKQTPEEKAFRAQQREALKKFLEEQAAKAEAEAEGGEAASATEPAGDEG